MIPIVILAIENEADRAFMQALYERCGKRMFAVAYSVLGNAHNADDAVGEALISLIKKISLIRSLERNTLETYIVITVKHSAIDFLRKREREIRHTRFLDAEAIENIPGDFTDADAELIRRETVERLKKSLSMLAESDLNLLTMKYVRNLTNQEIASELNIQESSVHSQIWRVKKRAYKILAGEEGSENE